MTRVRKRHFTDANVSLNMLLLSANLRRCTH